MVIINLLFDLDDTLYNPVEPFKKAFDDSFGFKNISVEKLYKLSRKYSDEAFILCENGEMTMEELRVYRIKKSLEEFDISVNKEEAIKFQKSYENYQKHIDLRNGFNKILDYCIIRKIKIGIITNGPKEHQLNKIKSLGLLNWFKRENIFISEELGYAKPYRKIFDIAVKQMSIYNQDIYYVGDNFINDIKGAKNAGWNTIWFSSDTVKIEEIEKYCDYRVGNTEDLYELIKTLNNNRVD